MPVNGRLDVNTLTKVPVAGGGFGYLEKPTAQGWFAAREDVIRTTGTTPVLIPDGLYRDYSRQVYWKQYWTRLGKPLNAATPGYSNHGLGTAVDINNISAYNQKTLDTVMRRHGFVRDTSESWHYHHTSINPADSNSESIQEEKPEKKDESMTIVSFIQNENGKPDYGSVAIVGALVPGGWKQLSSGLGSRAELTAWQAICGALAITMTGPISINSDAWQLSKRFAKPEPTVATGSFTEADRAMLDDIANKGELGAALTNTVNLVNSHADANKAQIIQEIDTHGGSSLSAFTATITPVE